MPQPISLSSYDKHFHLLAIKLRRKDAPLQWTADFPDEKQAMRFRFCWYGFIKANERAKTGLEEGLQSYEVKLKKNEDGTATLQFTKRENAKIAELSLSVLEALTSVMPQEEVITPSRFAASNNEDVFERMLAQGHSAEQSTEAEIANATPQDDATSTELMLKEFLVEEPGEKKE